MSADSVRAVAPGEPRATRTTKLASCDVAITNSTPDPSSVNVLDQVEELSCTAYHEAGHAVARLDQGRQTPFVTIEPEGDVLGYTEGTNELIGRFDVALILAAGPAAEALYRLPVDDDHCDANDVELAVGLVLHHSLLVGSHSEVTDAHALAPPSLECAGRLVVEQWPLVERIAAELLERGTLDDRQLRHLATGEGTCPIACSPSNCECRPMARRWSA